MNETKRIVEGALFAAIYAVFFLVSRYFGGALENFCFFMLPLPLIIYTLKYGIKKAWVPFIVIAILAILINPISGLLYVLSGNILGLIYGALLRKKTSLKIRLFILIITSAIVNLLAMVVFANLLGYSLMEDLTSIFTFIFKTLNLNLGIHASFIVQASIPIFILITAIVEGWLLYAFTTYVLKYLSKTSENPGTIMFYTLPRIWGVYFIITSLLYIVSYTWMTPDVSIVKRVYAIVIFNLFWIETFFFFVQGVMTYLQLIAKKKKRVLGLLFFYAIMLFFSVYGYIVYCGVGIILVISDFHSKILYNI